MKSVRFAWVVLAGALFLVCPHSARAHHGNAAYDMEKLVTVPATITMFYWMNPHCEILFDVAAAKGSTQHWVIETHPPTMMRNHNWTRKSLNPGDKVTITFHPAKNGAHTGILFKVVLPNGQELKHDA